MLWEAQSRAFDEGDIKGALQLWKPLEELRDAIYAQVADVELVGSDTVIVAAHSLRRTVRRAPGLLTRDLRFVAERARTAAA